MSTHLLKIATLATGLLAAQPSAQAAGFSAAFGPLRTLVVTTGDAVPTTAETGTFCVAVSGHGPAFIDLASFDIDKAPEWDV